MTQLPPNEQTEYNLTNHTPTPEGIERIEKIRAAGKEFAKVIHEEVPDGREKSLALTNLEQTGFWANAGIARIHTDDATKENDNA